MIKTGTVFIGDTKKVNRGDLPANHSSAPISQAQIKKQEQQQSDAFSQLENLALDDEPVLMQLTTVFPFEFFPTTLTIEKTKVNIKKTLFFFGASDIRSILISDIVSVESQSNLFFGTLQIEKRMPPESPIIVHYLPRELAQQARRIIQGLMVTVSNKVDVTKVSTSDLKTSVEALGDSKVAA